MEIGKRLMEAVDQAKQNGWIRSKGVSCHSLPALQLAAISLPEETKAGATAAAPATEAAPAATTAEAAPAVPQAFTWGKQLPGGPAPGAAAAPAATTPAVPQAYTWGKTLPTVAAPAAN